MPAIWWIRRDLRLDDNPALNAALSFDGQVIPLFIIDPFFERSGSYSERRALLLNAALISLDADLRARTGRLIIRRGEPLEALRRLVAETGAGAIYAEADYGPYAQRRDTAVAAALPLHLTGGQSVQPIDAVHKEDGTPYTVFTPYSRRWLALPLPGQAQLLKAPGRIPGLESLGSEPLPTSPAAHTEFLAQASESQAQQWLARFTSGAGAPIYNYAKERDLLMLTGTSRLSVFLRFGLVSARRAVSAGAEALANARSDAMRPGPEAWIRQLIWRDFYRAILFHFPQVARGSFRPEFDAISWRNDPDEFRAWCAGETGYPIVDAAMRQLNESGWMHNRARMIVASFLVKDLLIDWRWGERYFMQQLLDGEIANNNGGWQWAAGTGTDAAPYFRIFNPVSQSRRFDPEGAFIRRWLPMLGRLPAEAIHAPWLLNSGEQAYYGLRIGFNYPAPIVDHEQARARALETYRAVRG